MFKQIFLLAAVFISAISFGQGEIRGKVTDKSNSQPIPFVKVKVEGQNKGANTDFDGEYSIKVPTGKYTLVFTSQEGHIEKKEEVTVSGSEPVILNVVLTKSKAVQDVGEVTVSAQKTDGAKTVAADDARRRDEQGATEGVTREQILERGANNAVEAVQMAPGLSVEDGKSVYVRGLGDRYTKTILNGMAIPGLDPDRNSVQMDIFPTAVVDNITVYKTFLPRFAGDYTGGLVDITTRDFPAQRNLYVKASLGYNTKTTFNPDYLSYEGGKLDWLGFDDGTRALPFSKTATFPDPSEGDQLLSTRTNAFSDIMAAEKSSNFLNQNYVISYGDRLERIKEGKDKLTYGYNVVLNYRNIHNYYDSVQFNTYQKTTDTTASGAFAPGMEIFGSQKGSLGEHNVMWTGLLGQSVKIRRSKISLVLFHTQNGLSSATKQRTQDFYFNPAILEKQSLTYTQRSVSNLNLNGRHFLDSAGRWKLDWKLSPTYSKIVDPDVRSTILEEIDDGNGNISYALTQGVGAEIRRIFRYLNEYNLSGRFDLAYSFKPWKKSEKEGKKDLKSELSFGGLDVYKHRSYEVYNYIFEIEHPTTYSEDPNWYFQEANVWTVESDTGTYGIGQQELANNFVARQNVMGGYIMHEMPFSKNFEATYGARVESAKNWYTGQNNLGNIKYQDTLVLNNLNVLPSVNLVYKIEKKADSVHYARYTNIRAAYGTTVARPSFKEKSIAQIYDPIQGRRYNGNINLKQTMIHNFDARWEYFFGRTELLSLSGFYKRFYNPIELVTFITAPYEVQPINSGQADVFGGEVEVRKALFFNKPEKSHLTFMVGANYTYVVSRVDMNKVYLPNATGEIQTEKSQREKYAREGEKIGDYRSMYGQSPWIVNAFVTFRNDSLGLVINLNYNVQGKKLAVIGVGNLPDVYEQPFHSLNFKASKTLDKSQNWKLSLQAQNLLMSARRKFYEAYNTESEIYSYMRPGTVVSASVTYQVMGKKDKKDKEKSKKDGKKI